jgi:hypothetical protein
MELKCRKVVKVITASAEAAYPSGPSEAPGSCFRFFSHYAAGQPDKNDVFPLIGFSFDLAHLHKAFGRIITPKP